MWRARPASREPGLPRASALAASSRSAVPALARAPRSWPRVGASRTAASPVFLGPVPRGNPPRPRGARGWARPHLLWSRLAVEGVRAPRWWSVPCGRGVVGVAVDEGRSVALRWLSVCVWVLRWGRRGRPLAGLARSPGAAHPPACVEGERGRERREVVSPVALRGRVWRPVSVRPSLPPSVGAFAPHAAARGGRGPWPPWLFFVSASPSPGRYPLRRRPAGRRGVRAPMRVTPGCCEFGEGEGLADPLRPGFPGGDPASVGCASRGLRVSKILHPRRPPLPPASRGPPETVRRLVLPCRRVPSLSRPPPRSLLPAAGRVSPLSDRDLRSDVATR